MQGFIGFLRHEDSGSATLWNLFWLLGFASLLGVGVDTTAAMNTKARLQTVADAAAHAGTMDIFPVATDAIDTALAYAQDNTPNDTGVVEESDVTLGFWDTETREFRTDDAVPYLNAVRVAALRNPDRDNELASFFLRVVGFDNWDIAAAATATYFNDLSQTANCRGNGFLAGDEMEKTSNNVIVGAFCIHGETSLKINNNNIITCGSEISTPDPSAWKTGTAPSGMPPEECNTDYASLSDAEMLEQATIYKSSPSYADLEYYNVKEMLDAYVSGAEVNDPFNAIPPYIVRYETVSPSTFNLRAKIGALLPGTLYVTWCDGTGQSLKPEGIIRNVGIYTDCVVNVAKDQDVSLLKPTKTTGNPTVTTCDPDVDTCESVPWDAQYPFAFSCSDAATSGFEIYLTFLDTAEGETYRDGETVDTEAQPCGIEPGATGLWDNVFLFTTAYEDTDHHQNSVTFPNNMQIGRLDNCEEGGGVRIYAGGSLATPSGTMIRGSHIIALGDVSLAAKASGAQGTTIEVMGDIEFSAQGSVGGCPADVEYLASDVVITVRPVAIVN